MNKTIVIINQYAASPDLGMEVRHYYLAVELKKMGYRVYIIAATYTHLRSKMPNVKKDISLEVRGGVNFIWIRVPVYKNAHSKLRIVNWFDFAWKIGRLQKILPEQPDVILYSSPSLIGYLGAEKLARACNARVGFEVRDIWPLTLCQLGKYSPINPLIWIMQRIEDRAYRNSDVVISNLKNSIDHMVSHGLASDKFHWIPNGYSKQEIENSVEPPPETFAKLSDGKFTIAYCGTLGVANGVEVLVQAASILKGEELIKFVIIGRGQERESLVRLARKQQLDNVIFVDPVPKNQVQGILGCVDVLYIGLKKEPLFRYGVSPNKLFDYLYAGKPIIYAIDSGEYHPISNSESGLEIPPEDPEKLAAAILKLYEMKPQLRRQMGENGHRLAINDYEYGSLARKLAKALFASECIVKPESGA